MINELQMCKESYPEMLTMYLKQIFIMLQRSFATSVKTNNTQAAEEIDKATLYFNEHYSEDIYVDECAKEHNISISWFIATSNIIPALRQCNIF